MSNELREYENRAVQKTLLATYCPTPIREARERQDAILRQRFEGEPLAIADVGCGDGYHGSILAPSCRVYHGFEISPAMVEMTRERWRREGLDNARVFAGDATEIELEDDFYDLVLCVYFTPGNFRDESADLSLYTDAYLDRNPKFIAMVAHFHRAMKPGGSMLLTVYKDVPEAEAAQVDFYTKTDQHVVTPPGSRYVATAEHFWSARFTRRSMLSNLAAAGIDERDVVFHDLNAIAWLVEIRKPSGST